MTIEVCEDLRQVVERAADDFDVVVAAQVPGESRCCRELFHVLRELFPAAAAPLGVLHPVEPALFDVMPRPGLCRVDILAARI